MDVEQGLRGRIWQNLIHKANLKQTVTDNTLAVFSELKETLHEMASELDDQLDDRLDKRIRIEYRDRGKFEAQLQVADDILVFMMCTDVFEFNRDHAIWKNAYVKASADNAYCGIINIYNFLSDSFKYNRAADEGYLIGRIFINREMCYFVEGKKQLEHRSDKFGGAAIDRGVLLDIASTAIDCAVSFDLLVPPYDAVKIASVDQFNTKLEHSRMRVGKRLGYDFNTDDV